MCFHYGGAGSGTEVGVLGGYPGTGPGAVTVWRQLASSLLKYRSPDIDIKNIPIALKLDGRIYCCIADPPVLYHSD